MAETYVGHGEGKTDKGRNIQRELEQKRGTEETERAAREQGQNVFGTEEGGRRSRQMAGRRKQEREVEPADFVQGHPAIADESELGEAEGLREDDFLGEKTEQSGPGPLQGEQ